MCDKRIQILRCLSLADATSFLILLGIAMPLRTYADMPEAVSIVGMIHGLLFIALCLQILIVLIQLRWQPTRGLLIFSAALVPLAPFFLDKHIRRWAEHSSTPQAA